MVEWIGNLFTSYILYGSLLIFGIFLLSILVAVFFDLRHGHRERKKNKEFAKLAGISEQESKLLTTEEKQAIFWAHHNDIIENTKDKALKITEKVKKKDRET